MTTVAPELENFVLRKQWDYGRNGEQSENALAQLRERGQIAPDGNPFPWGTIIETHVLGEHAIVEYVRDQPVFAHGEYVQPDGAHQFHPYLDGRDTCRSAETLEKAIVISLAYKYDGPNSQAASMFFRMVQIDRERD